MQFEFVIVFISLAWGVTCLVDHMEFEPRASHMTVEEVYGLIFLHFKFREQHWLSTFYGEFMLMFCSRDCE